MTTQLVEILDAATGSVMGDCQGPTAAGECPEAGGGVVPCAGYLVKPQHADPQYWPLWVPPNSRHCALGWRRRAAEYLRLAEAHRDEWCAGLQAETELVKQRAARGDKRFRNKSPTALETIGRLRWSHSPHAQELAETEQAYRQRAQAYLAFARLHPYRFPAER